MRSKALVVYYSRSGVTSRVAEHIAESLKADIERIEESGSRLGAGGYVRSAFEAFAKGLPTIRTLRDPRDYDIVVIGTPVWTGTMCSPVRSYISLNRSGLKHAAFFAVMAGRGAEETVREMKLACNAPAAPTCALRAAEVEGQRLREKCAAFIQSLQSAESARAQQDGGRAAASGHADSMLGEAGRHEGYLDGASGRFVGAR